ncbi:MAG: hypothetical protein BRD45_03000 [Bacteroidetes bacterium QS_8_64_10]|jgi:uncharacterized membrane protein|nr:MAG: hypothetical protein BRD45_03000 [Bacteroidetes bacterium QS_8_64_10]
MSDSEEPLADRVERLEREVSAISEGVEALHDRLDDGAEREDDGDSSSPPATEMQRQQPSPKRKRTSSFLQREASWSWSDWESEDWLSRIGIALTLFGVAFFFKFAADRGWLTPPVQVALGALLGVVLLVTGLRLWAERERLGQILMGGSSAVFYATVFAAHQLFAPYALAFACMVLVTAGTFFLAVRQRDVALSVVGVLGGLGTPFLLYTGAGSMAGLVVYACLILMGAALIYLYRGWRTLLYVTVAGGWLTFWFAYVSLPPGEAGAAVLQGGILTGWLLFWWTPLAREVLAGDEQAAREQRHAEEASSLIGAFLFRPPAHTLAFSSPLIALAFSQALWSVGEATWGVAALAGAVLYVAAHQALRRRKLPDLAQAHLLAAVVLAAYGFSALLGGDAFLVALAAEAAALHVLSRSLEDRLLRFTAHFFFALAGVLVAARLALDSAETPVFVRGEAFSEGVVLALAAAVSAIMERRRVRRIYRVVAHVLFLAWIVREMSALPSGQAYASIVWGVYAVGLLVAGGQAGRSFLRTTGALTLLALVAKLFLVDLAALDALWRVLLFLGFGAAFLVLSYLHPDLPGK